MAIEKLIRVMCGGLWDNEIEKIKTQLRQQPLVLGDTKLLRERIANALSHGRKGWAFNFLIVYWLAEPQDWQQWIRKSGILRASRYDFADTIPKFLVSKLLESSQELHLDQASQDYLTSISNLIRVAPAINVLQTSLLKRLKQEQKTVIKGLLATLDLCFLIREELHQLEFDGQIPEVLADGFSYLLFLFTERIGRGLVQTGPLNMDKAVTDHYLEMMKDAATLRVYMEWEILIDFFKYGCTYVADDKTLVISPHSERFQKSLRFGFIQHSMQQIAADKHIAKDQPPSLRDLGERLYGAMMKANLIQLNKEPFPRWRFEFPHLGPMRDLVNNPGYLREEASSLTAIAKDLFVDTEQLEKFEIAGQKTWSIIRVQRLVNLMRYVIAAHLKKFLKDDFPVVVQSLIPVFHRDQIMELFEVVMEPADANRLLELLTWNPEKPTVFDALYQPIIHAKPDWFMLPTNVLGSASIVRNLMALKRARFAERKNDPLGDLFANLVRLATDNCASSIEFEFHGRTGELDVIILHDNFVFIFECKNSLHPCSVFELRTSYDYILEGKQQLDRVRELWKEEEFRFMLEDKLGWKLNNAIELITCILTGNRIFSGLEVGGHSVLGFYELANFILTGHISILEQDVQLREEGRVTGPVLRNFVLTGTLYDKTFAAMKPLDKLFHLGGFAIRKEDFTLDPRELAEQFGVNVPPEIEKALASDDGS